MRLPATSSFRSRTRAKASRQKISIGCSNGFYRVEKSCDRARGGAGIALAIVKQFVEGNGDRGGGITQGMTRFWFRVPE